MWSVDLYTTGQWAIWSLIGSVSMQSRFPFTLRFASGRSANFLANCFCSSRLRVVNTCCRRPKHLFGLCACLDWATNVCLTPRTTVLFHGPRQILNRFLRHSEYNCYNKLNITTEYTRWIQICFSSFTGATRSSRFVFRSRSAVEVDWSRKRNCSVFSLYRCAWCTFCCFFASLDS